MKRALGLFGSLLVLATAPAAWAQTEEPPPLPPPTAPVAPQPPPPAAAPPSVAPATPAPAAEPAKSEKKDDKAPPGPRPVPDARTGFQMALRTGVQVPMGKLQSGTAMYDVFSPQVPFQLDIGFKPIPHLFLGAYLGLAVGGVNNRLADQCDRTNAECGSASFFIGLEAQYHFLPDRKINPWIGYGLGFEGAGVGNSTGSQTSTTTAWSGFDFARFSGGFDVRLSRVIGIGPIVDLTLGRYGHVTTKTETPAMRTTDDSSVDEKRVHGWLTIGGRLVFFP